MASGVEVAGSIVSLIDAALRIVNEARKARHRVLGIPTTLDNVSKQLNSIEESLTLVREERNLQSFAIEQQLQTIAQVAEELRQFYDRLSLVQQRSSTSKFVRSLRMGDREEKELEGILKRLDTAKGDLTVRILVAHVGVVGNFHDGFRVAYDVLAETNLNVQRVLGVNMALLEVVENRDRKLDGTIPVVAAELEALEAPRFDASSEVVQNSIYSNKGVGFVMTGNVGVETNYQAAPRTNAITNNDFGKDGKVMTGDMGGAAAESFNQNFWK
uniref:NACHT-NTPase and P-loop NTPases N-terminal domain-containing protein n=1 Tax=Gibberella zeae TaxID=5518 RepID=A0A4E9EIZ5_GIBZA